MDNIVKKVTFPAITLAMFLVISFGIISIGHILSNKALLYLDYKSYGLDYIDFFNASERIINGESPYNSATNRYVTTPIPAIVNIVFVPLGFDNARILFYFLIPISLAIGYMLVTSLFDFTETDQKIVLITGLITLLFGYPFYFLVQRENIDGWVLFFLCLGLYWLTKPKKELISGLFFSLAIMFKIYPILIVLPILLNRKWRLLFWIGLWLALWGAISLFWISDFQTTLSMRSQSLFRFDENGSIVATISLITLLINALGVPVTASAITYSPIIAALLFGTLLSFMIVADYKLSKIEQLDISSYIMYLPFMIALPQLVYHYSLIICLILIPTVCYLWKINENKKQRLFIFLISIGVGLTQWQAIATYNLTDNLLSHAIPGLGLLLIIISATIYKNYNLFLKQSQIKN